MNKIFRLLIIFCLSALSLNAAAQQVVPPLATHIAQKMKDSLALTATQFEQIQQANLKLDVLKTQARRIYKQRDSLQISLQRIENTRDGLYRTIITDDQQYQLYKKKKKNLVTAN